MTIDPQNIMLDPTAGAEGIDPTGDRLVEGYRKGKKKSKPKPKTKPATKKPATKRMETEVMSPKKTVRRGDRRGESREELVERKERGQPERFKQARRKRQAHRESKRAGSAEMPSLDQRMRDEYLRQGIHPDSDEAAVLGFTGRAMRGMW